MTRTLSASLPVGALYVSGTVNGAATTWTNTEGNTWETIADRAPDDVYRVRLTIINSLGTSVEQEFTLYYGLHLITDRTQADVDRVEYLAGLWTRDGWTGTDEELAEWFAGPKGAYNASDLNRVGAAMLYLEAKFQGYGYTVTVEPKTDWSMEDIPRKAELDHYLADVRALRGVCRMFADTPAVPDDMDKLTYQEANDIEKILEDTDRAITNMAAAWYYSGELYTGEV